MAELDIRPLEPDDLREAERVMRLAFGTFVGLPEPESFGGDSSFVASRWRSQPEQAFGAFMEGELVGSNLATRWGRFAFFGPLSVHPKYWGRGFARPLMEPVIALLDSWELAGSGLFTFPHSVKHISFYQSFDFRPGMLNVIFQKPLDPRGTIDGNRGPIDCDTACCRSIAEEVSPGLDLSHELDAAARLELGYGVLTDSRNGFAVCHEGANSEAGSDTCYVKFGAVRRGATASADFADLLDSCEALARRRGSKLLVAGMNVGRRRAYEMLLRRGYQPVISGVAMHRPGPPLWAGDEDFVIDDWR